MDNETPLMSLTELSQFLNISKRWLRKEASEERIPSLNAGGRLMVLKDAVQENLVDRASNPLDQLGNECSKSFVSSELDSWEYHPDGSSPGRWETAIHEAGHAVVAHSYGIPVKSLLLDPDGGGKCAIDSTTLSSPLIVMIAAGPIAQKRWANEFIRPVKAPSPETLERLRHKIEQQALHSAPIRYAQASDESRLREWVTSRCARNPELWSEKLCEIDREANEILELHKDCVQNLARALYMSCELIGDDAVNAMYWPGGERPTAQLRKSIQHENIPNQNTVHKGSANTTAECTEDGTESEAYTDLQNCDPETSCSAELIDRVSPRRLPDVWLKGNSKSEDFASANGWSAGK